MQKHSLKFRKGLINIACSPLILILNNSELAAKNLLNEIKQPNINSEINKINNGLIKRFDIKKESNLLIAENENNISQESALVSEIIIEGWENHPEGRKLELAAYDSMSIKPEALLIIKF